jgi:SAM-dependent methyltransferase
VQHTRYGTLARNQLSPNPTAHLFDRFYYDRPEFLGGTIRFQLLCERMIAPHSKILEIGAGPSNEFSDYLATLGRVHGVDVSEEATSNRALASATTYDGANLPFADGSVDACVSNYVLEHVTNPDRHFAEVARVLVPGGVYVFRTPNLFHYVSLASRLLPHRIHTVIANRLRALADGSHEPWPTVYRANTHHTIKKLTASVGLKVETCLLIEPEPSYGRASRLLFYPMMAYERVVNSTDWLAAGRANILCGIRKPAV